MVANNGNGLPSPADFKVRVAETERAIEWLHREADKLVQQAEAHEQHLAEIKAQAARAGIAVLAEQGVRRSKLSALEKSRLIDQIGGEAYLQLPW